MRISRSIRTVLGTGAALALAGCNEALVPDFNTLTGFPHQVSSLQTEMTGVFNGLRELDVFNMAIEMDAFSRSATYFTPSEIRFVTELTGEAELDDDNFGANVWNNPFTAIKSADTIIAILPTLTGSSGSPFPTANVQALEAVMETHKAFDYMYVALSHDTNGVAMNSPGGAATGKLAPILCARDSWAEIVAMLDTAKAELDAAGAGTQLALPNSGFTLQMPPGYAALGNTAGGFKALTLALRGRARIEYAYAIARGPGGTAPSTTTPGAPDQAQLDSAITDITASSLYSPNLSAAEAIPANDLGVFMSFSSAAGDLSNPIFAVSAGTYAMEGAAQQIDTLHDQRFLAKFATAPAPTSAGASKASSYAYLNNIGLSTPIPMVRNLELQFLLARAYLGTNQLAKAAQTVDAVRTTVGGLASGLGGVNTTSYPSVRDFLMREMLPSLMEDGTGDQIIAIRDYGLVLQDLTTWGASDFHTSMLNIPSVERQQRNNQFAAVCP
ncbi:MAG TPA: hypothetical protein VK807_11705 [Gemmatimonadaceae bacterium]|jgi:hypothetical protein|nr:hypothetical protein [Gemmatimonadaceae bacterium]